MKRKIIQIDEEKCSGCGICAAVCHEGAIGMANGKARLLRDDHCDGLGDCLPACPTKAISFVEREADPYNEAVVLAGKAEKTKTAASGCACPGAASRSLSRECSVCAGSPAAQPSRLSQWPVQIRLAPVSAPYFRGASLLVAADCTAYAYAGFHERFIKGRVTLVGCPKLDPVDYAEKLTEILRRSDIRDITIVRMEVPCCGGLEAAVARALQQSGKSIPRQVFTISIAGEITD